MVTEQLSARRSMYGGPGDPDMIVYVLRIFACAIFVQSMVVRRAAFRPHVGAKSVPQELGVCGIVEGLCLWECSSQYTAGVRKPCPACEDFAL